jgi:hypothetical protein
MISGSNSGQCEVIAAAAPWRGLRGGKLRASCVGWRSCDGLSGFAGDCGDGQDERRSDALKRLAVQLG